MSNYVTTNKWYELWRLPFIIVAMPFVLVGNAVYVIAECLFSKLTRRLSDTNIAGNGGEM